VHGDRQQQQQHALWRRRIGCRFLARRTIWARQQLLASGSESNEGTTILYLPVPVAQAELERIKKERRLAEQAAVLAEKERTKELLQAAVLAEKERTKEVLQKQKQA
jgi:hypothetical protein